MKKLDNQKAAFNFLLNHYRTQKVFSKADLEQQTAWTGTTFPTYWSKHFKTLVVPVGEGAYRVSQSFRQYSTWPSFRDLVTQVRKASSQYSLHTYNHLIIYEFFMPLTNEGHLRTALDALFYKNTLLVQLRTLDKGLLTKYFPKESGEPQDRYLERICDWISQRFGGYSISHVNGRFRGPDIATMKEAARIQEDGSRYLVDETTAIVRFIFPCGTPIDNPPPPLSEYLLESSDVYEEPADADAIRWLFYSLFVQSIIQVVNGEDEIWMVESGMRNRLHIWRVES